jgi:DNA helicase-2/ATP-dependent DNA helicase PcrA
MYPVEPSVLDEWELANIFDAEFSKSIDKMPSRCKLIRRDYEAFWSTGEWNPASYVEPDPPITEGERTAFKVFHHPRIQLYACVLPGEVVRNCVDRVSAGTLSIKEQLETEQLVVDEYQDLNPADQEMADLFVMDGAGLFVAGDDDQSVYSFRFASPAGLQQFTTRYPDAGTHVLEDCFRCMPEILDAATSLIADNSPQQRIEKNLVSLYESARPPLTGHVFRWRFAHGKTEANSIAKSCKALIEVGVNPRDILVLMGNVRTLEQGLRQAFQAEDVPYDRWGAKRYVDIDAGRFVLSLLRILTDADDYVAYRSLLTLLKGVGIGTCVKIAEATVASNLNFKDLFFAALPGGVFDSRSTSALVRVRDLVEELQGWTLNDSLEDRRAAIEDLLISAVGAEANEDWASYAADFPDGMSLEELRDYLWSDSEEVKDQIMAATYERLEMDPPTVGAGPARVRIMTMHGAKGLDAQVVFIPGLEEEFFPGRKRLPYPGQVQEAARLLYVSITRAKVACVLSYAARRFIYGKNSSHAPSRFTSSLNGSFVNRSGALTAEEVAALQADCATVG